MKYTVVQLKKLLSDNKISEVLQAIHNGHYNRTIHDEATLLLARWKKLEGEINMGVLSPEKTNIFQNEIRYSLLHLLNKIEGHDTLKPPSFSQKRRLIGISSTLILMAFLIYFAMNRSFEPDLSSNSLTILVHSKKAKDQCPLGGRGIVKLAYGDAIRTKTINTDCEAIFTQIDDVFFDSKEGVEIWFEDPEKSSYRVIQPDSIYQLRRGQYISLAVEQAGMESITGVVYHHQTGERISGVTVRAQGQSAQTNQYGEFTLYFPKNKQAPLINLAAFCQGFKDWEMNDVSTITETRIAINLKPL